MRRLWIMISGVMLFVASASAKVWLLPDYQQQQIFSHRVNGGVETPPVQPETTVDCRRYGMIPASEVSDGMSCSSSTQILETVCYGGCSCSAAYSQTSSSCRSEGKIPAGSSCMGEYFTDCICDTSLYPHTSSSCAYTPGGASCSDDDGKHFAECKNPCDGLTDNETDLGCEKYYDNCPSLCELGKTCVPNDCSGYSLTSCPANAYCINCQIGCGNNKTTYAMLDCNSGYYLDGNSCLCRYGSDTDCQYSSYSYPLYGSNYGAESLVQRYGKKCLSVDDYEICTVNCPAGSGLRYLPPEYGESQCIPCTIHTKTEFRLAAISCEDIILATDFDGSNYTYVTIYAPRTSGGYGYNGKPVSVTAAGPLNALNSAEITLYGGDSISGITFNNTPIQIETTIQSVSTPSPYDNDPIMVKDINVNCSNNCNFGVLQLQTDDTVVDNVHIVTNLETTYALIVTNHYPTIINSSFKNTSPSSPSPFCSNGTLNIKGDLTATGWAKNNCSLKITDNSTLNLSANTVEASSVTLENNAVANIKADNFSVSQLRLSGTSQLNLSTENITGGWRSYVYEGAVIMLPSGLYRANKYHYIEGNFIDAISQGFTRIGDYDESVFP